MLIWCGMVIFPTRFRTIDGSTHEFVVNGSLVKHIMNPRGHRLPDNDNGDMAA